MNSSYTLTKATAKQSTPQTMAIIPIEWSLAGHFIAIKIIAARNNTKVTAVDTLVDCNMNVAFDKNIINSYFRAHNKVVITVAI
jgi:hypothetical protein